MLQAYLLVLLSAAVERVGVSRMRDFYTVQVGDSNQSHVWHILVRTLGVTDDQVQILETVAIVYIEL